MIVNNGVPLVFDFQPIKFESYYGIFFGLSKISIWK